MGLLEEHRKLLEELREEQHAYQHPALAFVLEARKVQQAQKELQAQMDELKKQLDKLELHVWWVGLATGAVGTGVAAAAVVWMLGRCFRPPRRR